MRFCLLICCVIVGFSKLDAQVETRTDLGYIVKFRSEVNSSDREKCLSKYFPNCTRTCLSETFRYHHISPDADAQSILIASESQEIEKIFPNFAFESRSEERLLDPNDPEIEDQYYLERINAFEAWDISTSGETLEGDAITLAVYDDGWDFTNPDLDSSVVWINENEIPDNGIDDDNNGAIDDYFGYSVLTDNGDISGPNRMKNDHGNAVMGVIAATANNGISGAGLIWDASILALRRGGNTFAEWINAADYTYQLRKKWNETRGAEGAFVVAMNLSFGLGVTLEAPGAADFCAELDSLGSVGIISVGATTNETNCNVDSTTFVCDAGDIPSNCPSDQLIMVTETDRIDGINGGIGSTSIDLAAPSFNVLVLSQDGDQIEGGTSFATPQVTAAVGLIYSVYDPSMLQLAIDNPREAANRTKALILDNVSKVPEHEGLTVSEGILDLRAALEAASEVTSVEDRNENFAIKVLLIGDMVQVSGLPDRPSSQYHIRIVDLLGRTVQQESAKSSTFNFRLGNYPSGLYIIDIRDSQGKRLSAGRFFKK